VRSASGSVGSTPGGSASAISSVSALAHAGRLVRPADDAVLLAVDLLEAGVDAQAGKTRAGEQRERRRQHERAHPPARRVRRHAVDRARPGRVRTGRRDPARGKSQQRHRKQREAGEQGRHHAERRDPAEAHEALEAAGLEGDEAGRRGERRIETGTRDVGDRLRERGGAGAVASARGGEPVRVRRHDVDAVADADREQERRQDLEEARARPAEPALHAEREDERDAHDAHCEQRGRPRAEGEPEQGGHQRHDGRHQALRLLVEIASGHHELDRPAREREGEAARLEGRDRRERGVDRPLGGRARRILEQHDQGASARIGRDDLRGPERISERARRELGEVGRGDAARRELARAGQLEQLGDEQRARGRSVHAPHAGHGRELRGERVRERERDGIEDVPARRRVFAAERERKGHAAAEAGRDRVELAHHRMPGAEKRAVAGVAADAQRGRHEAGREREGHGRDRRRVTQGPRREALHRGAA
jgi:hypothetical protein